MTCIGIDDFGHIALFPYLTFSSTSGVISLAPWWPLGGVATPDGEPGRPAPPGEAEGDHAAGGGAAHPEPGTAAAEARAAGHGGHSGRQPTGTQTAHRRTLL